MSGNGFGSRTTAQQVFDAYKTDLSGKVIIITGPTTGIGIETARVLALTKAYIILAARNEQKGRELEKTLKEQTKNENIEWLPLDLEDLNSVKKFTELFLSKSLPLHVLLLNAGMQAFSFQKTPQGFEKDFGVNHIAHFYLTNLLLDKLKASAPSRIVVVSGGFHSRGVINFDDLNYEKASYAPFAVYSNSKLANALFAKELSRKLEGTKVTVNFLHPGGIKTGLTREINAVLRGLFFFLGGLFMKSVPQGAATSVYCAISPDLENVNGTYFVDCNVAVASATANNPEIAARFWGVTEKLVNEATAGGNKAEKPEEKKPTDNA